MSVEVDPDPARDDGYNRHVPFRPRGVAARKALDYTLLRMRGVGVGAPALRLHRSGPLVAPDQVHRHRIASPDPGVRRRRRTYGHWSRTGWLLNGGVWANRGSQGLFPAGRPAAGDRSAARGAVADGGARIGLLRRAARGAAVAFAAHYAA